MKVSAGRECRVCGEDEREAMKNRAASPDGFESICRPCARDAAASYRAQNPDRLRESWAKDRAAHAPRRRAEVREWTLRNPGLRRAMAHRYRARKAGSACPTATAAEVAAIADERGTYACVVCFGPAEHLDHVIPLARGGCGAAHNLQWLCAECNQSKSARDLAEWLPGRLAHIGGFA